MTRAHYQSVSLHLNTSTLLWPRCKSTSSFDKWCLDRKFSHSSVLFCFFLFERNRLKSCGNNSCALQFSVICLIFKLMIINNIVDWLRLYLLHLMEQMDGGTLLQAAPEDHQKLVVNANLEHWVFLLSKHTRQKINSKVTKAKKKKNANKGRMRAKKKKKTDRLKSWMGLS